MTENLLQFLWRFQYLNKAGLQTMDGEALQIIRPGQLNTNQGPDFLDASIRVNGILLAGNIEIHIKSSNWVQHKHCSDKNYSNIILHVVWEHDTEVEDINGQAISTLELKSIVPKVLLQQYNALMQSADSLPCKNYLPALSPIGWLSWKERLATERLMDKAQNILNTFASTNNNWETSFWYHLAYNFGLKVNADFFKRVAESIEVNILAKHKNQIHQLEALLLGQANLLEENFDNDYAQLLQKEYQFLQKKYALKRIEGSVHFLRMRPSNFPTIRLAQLAMLISNANHLFSKIKSLNNVADVQKLFTVTCNDYWHYHFTLMDEPGKYEPKKLGKQTIDNIIINTVIPIVFAYGLYYNEEEYKTKSLQWLQALKAESNNITQQWLDVGIENKTAFDSQAFIHLTKNYCHLKCCLQCAVGYKIIAGGNK